MTLVLVFKFPRLLTFVIVLSAVIDCIEDVITDLATLLWSTRLWVTSTKLTLCLGQFIADSN